MFCKYVVVCMVKLCITLYFQSLTFVYWNKIVRYINSINQQYWNQRNARNIWSEDKAVLAFLLNATKWSIKNNQIFKWVVHTGYEKIIVKKQQKLQNE